MSNNALYFGVPCHVIEVDDHEVELVLVDAPHGESLWVDVAAPDLIIDPTDDEWAAARERT